MKRILVLSTWFPYPLSQGSKIRAYHLIKALAARYEIALVSFTDERIEPEWLDHVKSFCSRVELVENNPFKKSRLKSVLGWVSPLPSALYASYSNEMERRVIEVAKDWKPDAVFALTVITAPYALKVRDVRKVLDVDNLLSRYLREGYESASGGLNRTRKWFAWLKFKAYEARVFNQFDLCITVTGEDARRVNHEFSVPQEKTGVVSNGVDLTATQGLGFTPVPGSLIFNGSLTYEPNREAMVYFVKEIFPYIRRRVPEARLTITGKFDGVGLDWLPEDSSVRLTGYVENIKPLVGESWVCVVPLRQGAGTRLKILEAMSLGTPVVSTPKGAEGLKIQDGRHLLIGETSEQFAERTISLLLSAELRSKIAGNAKKLVAENYNWADLERHFADLVQNLETTRSGKTVNEPIQL